jgi:ABC-type polar amino acid transport system ATPase subunit
MSDINSPDIMIEVIDLRKNFKDVQVLKGINTRITRSEVVAVMGPSGSGKEYLFTLHEPIGRANIWSHIY